ncbi:glycosyltransferase family 2 protein [Leptospira sp. 96542]|nr:glycosyltransferase family 2 protein [Leptospira sp. 96542]
MNEPTDLVEMDINTLPVPLVSVCVATYNHDQYIENCLLSVLLQTGDFAVEILVGNDGNSPETPQIVERLMQRFPGVIRYYKHPQNLGASRNSQFLVRQARGKYIANLDGDDYWLPGKLAAQIAWMEARPDSPACYTNAIAISDSGRLLGVFTSVSAREVDLPFMLERGNFLNSSSLFYRTDLRDRILDIGTEFIDYRAHLLFASLGPLGFDDRVFVAYRVGTTHSMVKTMPEKVSEQYFEAICSVIFEPGVTDTIRRSALASFFSTYLLGAVFYFRFQPAVLWYERIGKKFPKDRFWVLSLGGRFVFQRLWRFVKRGGERAYASSSRLRVLHER